MMSSGINIHHILIGKFTVGQFIVESHKTPQQCVPCGLVVRIRGFHPRGTGSIPGMGIVLLHLAKSRV